MAHTHDTHVGPADRLIRLIIAALAIILAYYWLGGALAYAAYALGVVLAATAVTGRCYLYHLLHFHVKGEAPRWVVLLLVVLLVALPVSAVYLSSLFTEKAFLEDLSAMNEPYKQALFLTGQGKRQEAQAQFDMLAAQHAAFAQKYADYRPPLVKADGQFSGDVVRIGAIIGEAAPIVRDGNLTVAHTTLEGIRPIIQGIMKRNGLSALRVALVDFHDSMEVVLDAANAKDSQKTLDAIVDADGKLKAVEQESQVADIQAIRAALEKVRTDATAGNADALPADASTLKSSYVKVYLMMG